MASAHSTPKTDLSEPELLLRDLERNAAYWERQATREKMQSKTESCLKRRDRCLRLAAQIRDAMTGDGSEVT